MKWHSENFTTKNARLAMWHKWFAWHPVYIDQAEKWVWLETIEVKKEWYSFFPVICGYKTTYRLSIED